MKKRNIITGFIFVIIFVLSLNNRGYSKIIFDSPSGGFSTKKIQQVSGEITNYNKKRATLIINGIPQTIPVNNGRFKVSYVSSPGLNVVEIKADKQSEKVSFYAKVPKKDIKIVLTWDSATDVDLWVIDPKGEKCFYSNKSTSSGGNLDVDVVSGYGPETFTMANALPGNYSVQVQYYSTKGAPATRVEVYVLQYEGTPREKREKFQFVMTKGQQVYHLVNFNIENR